MLIKLVKSLFTLMVLFLLGFNSGIFSQNNTLLVDTKVAALFDDGNWYNGTIDKVEGNTYIINTFEGRQAYLERSRLKVLNSNIILKNGEHVAALYGSEKFYGGTVQKVDKDGAIIKWLDGSEPSFIEKSKIITNVGNYDYKEKKEEDASLLITFFIQNTEYQISKNTGRVLINKNWVGTFDLQSGSLSPHSSYNASGKVESNGTFYVNKGSSMSGYLSKNGDVIVNGKRILTFTQTVSAGKKFTWREMCLAALVSAVYLKY